MANAKIVISAVDQTRRVFSKVRGRVNQLGSAAAKLSAAAGLAAAVGLGALVTASLKTNDELAKTADRIGLTTEALRGFQLAGELAGVQQSTLNKALQISNVRLGEAQRGIGLAKQSLDQLNLSAGNLAALNPEERFLKIAGAISEVSDRTQQAKIATDLFGRSGVELLTLFDQGADSIRKTVEEAQLLGTSLNRVDAAKIEQANDAVTRVRAVFEGFVNRVAVKLAPIIEGISNSIRNAALESGGFEKSISNGFARAAGAVGIVADAFRALKVLFGLGEVAINAVVKKFGELALAGAKVKDFFSGSNSAEFWQGFVDAADQGISDVQKRVDDLALSPLPSETINQTIAGFQQISQAAAQSTAEVRKIQQQNLLGAGGEDPSIAKERERIAQRFKLLQAETAGELSLLKERENQKFAQQQELANQAFEAGLIGEQERFALVEELRAQHQQRLLDVTKEFNAKQVAEEQKRISSILQMNQTAAARQEEIDKLSAESKIKLSALAFKDALSIAASGSKKIFKINKALSLANAVVSGFAAINSGFATQPFFPVGLAMGALATAKTFAQIKSIRATTFGGGTPGGAPTGSVAPPISTQNNPASNPTVQGPGQPRRRGQLVVTGQGELFTRDTLIDLSRKQQELRDDGFTDIEVVFG